METLPGFPYQRQVELPPPPEDIATLAAAAPVMPGAEYLTTDILTALWTEIGAAFGAELTEAKASLQEFLKNLHPAWNVVGKVHFNLAENRKDEAAPFAFLATYTHRLSPHGKAQHLPLGQALRAYAGAGSKQKLLSLLLPVQRAAESCAWLRQTVDAGEIFHPLRWSPREAFQFLGDVPELERAGVVVRMPATWRSGRPSRPQVTATIGSKATGTLGKDALLDFRMEVTLDGESLSPRDVKEILAGANGLALIRGQWVEVDSERLQRMMARFEEANRVAAEEGLSFAEAMRMLAGADVAQDGAVAGADPDWSRVVAGPWLAETLRGLRSPEELAKIDPGRELHGTLRPYQEVGVRWLHLLSRLGLGACLADDMGLGKTVQTLALLLARAGAGPALVLAPTSVCANWESEAQTFAPGLNVQRFGEGDRAAALQSAGPRDVFLCSYGLLPLEAARLQAVPWATVVLDEGQNIKNALTKRSQAVMDLQAGFRLVLSGTPVENHLAELWNLFRFLNPGLLGTIEQFRRRFQEPIERAQDTVALARLRRVVSPFLLRRTKGQVLKELPPRTEIVLELEPSPAEAAFLEALRRQSLEALDGGPGQTLQVLAALMRLRRACCNPALVQPGLAIPSSKQEAFLDLVEELLESDHRALVFSQFVDHLALLREALDERGVTYQYLDGATPVRKRAAAVKAFQAGQGDLFLISLKAGGTGLNLTAADYIIHMDPWWNPAVEDQASDRAHRIGQTRPVTVYRLVLKGSVEQKILGLHRHKRQLAEDILSEGAMAAGLDAGTLLALLQEG